MKVVVKAEVGWVEILLKKPREQHVLDIHQYGAPNGLTEDDVVDIYQANGKHLAEFLEVEYEFVDNRS